MQVKQLVTSEDPMFTGGGAEKPHATQCSTQHLPHRQAFGHLPTVAVVGVWPGSFGEAIARVLAAMGFRVFLTNGDGPAVRMVADGIRQDGFEADYLVTDSTTDEGMKRFLEFIAERTAFLHGIVWAGSVCKRWPTRETTTATLNCFWREHLTSVCWMTRAALQQFFVPQGFGATVLLGAGDWHDFEGGQPIEAEMTNNALAVFLGELRHLHDPALRFHLVRPRCRLMEQPTFSTDWVTFPDEGWNPRDVALTVVDLLNGVSRQVKGKPELPAAGIRVRRGSEENR